MDKNKTLCLVKLTVAQRDLLRKLVLLNSERSYWERLIGGVENIDMLDAADVQLEFAEIIEGVHE